MKTLWTIALAAFFTLTVNVSVRAADKSYDFQTGSASLDRALNKIAGQGDEWPESLDVAREITEKFGINQALINRLVEMGYNYGEIYLMGLLHERAHVPVESLVAFLNKGMSWNEVVGKVGLTPQRINSYRMALNEAEKAKDALYSESLYQEGVPYYLKSLQEQQESLTTTRKMRSRQMQAIR